jgi:hypothetical protein
MQSKTRLLVTPTRDSIGDNDDYEIDFYCFGFFTEVGCRSGEKGCEPAHYPASSAAN